MSNRFILFLFLGILFSCSSLAQIYTDKDVKICEWTIDYAAGKKLSSRPIGDIITTVGKTFLKTDYLAYGIEKEGEEQLVVNLRGYDCTTFLESVLALSRLIKQGDTTFDDFTKQLTLIRYRDGIIDQYPSRLHYFSDWIYDNEQKGIVQDITQEIGGTPIIFDLDYMSEHPQYYTHLKENPDFVPVISKQEREIFKRDYHYIPKNKVEEAETFIKEGDLIAFTTSVKGLDIGHVGIAIKQKGRIHILHAPQIGEQVQITEKPLPEYIKGVKKHTGIIVLRALEPTNQQRTKSHELKTIN